MNDLCSQHHVIYLFTKHANSDGLCAVRVCMFGNEISFASLSCSLPCFLSTLPFVFPSALRPPPWLPKQRPRFHSAPEHHGILVVIPAELPVLPPDPPLLRLPGPPEPAEESSSSSSFSQTSPYPQLQPRHRSHILIEPPSVHYIIPTQPSSFSTLPHP